jgi:uncharacterized protein (TIGR02996 family)
MLDEREAFLRAIFDTPDDDTPRLVYADWLDEHGDPVFAAFIRLACEYARTPAEDVDRRGHLAAEGLNLMRPTGRSSDGIFHRGFVPPVQIEVDASLLADAAAFRHIAAVDHPEWFGATRLKVTGGLITGVVQVETLFTASATAKVTALDLCGVEEPADPRSSVVQMEFYQLVDVNVRPVITVLGVESLTNHRGARRLTELLLADNDLDNDAARILLRSPYLIRLERLEIQRGNHLRGKTWAQLRERFGEDVVS